MAVQSLQIYNKIIIVSCVIAIQLSAYALFVKMSAEANKDYVAMCDISEQMSCSKVFTSKYGRGLGLFGENSPFYLPNGFNGVFFYSIFLLLGLSDNAKIVKLQYYVALAAIFLSFYLAYILFYVLNDFCIVCTSIYVLNVINLIFTYVKVQKTKTTAEVKTVKKKNK